MQVKTSLAPLLVVPSKRKWQHVQLDVEKETKILEVLELVKLAFW